MIVRKVNYTLPDDQGNVNVGTVKTINSERPDQNGDITLDFAPYDDVELLASALSQHMQTMASKDDRGHVFIDNETIVVNANGEISAAPPEWEPFIDDSTITVNPQGRLSAPLSTEYYHNGNRVSGVKIAMVTAVTTGTEGLWTANYSDLGLQQIFSIQATMQAGNFSAANAPLATNVRSFTLTTATGTAFKASSAGLLAAMQQTRAEPGTEIYLQIIGR